MRFAFFHGDPARRLGALMRLQHAAWLTRAVRRAEDYPRIPSREVRSDWEGGFGGMMSSREGRQWAAGWWAKAFEEMSEADAKESGGRRRWRRRRR